MCYLESNNGEQQGKMDESDTKCVDDAFKVLVGEEGDVTSDSGAKYMLKKLKKN